MNIDVILVGIFIVSTLTGLTAEAVKTVLNEYSISYHGNTLAGIIATVLSLVVSIAYIAVTGTAITGEIIVSAICLIFFSWLCAMVGYDKVIQTISQIQKG